MLSSAGRASFTSTAWSSPWCALPPSGRVLQQTAAAHETSPGLGPPTKAELLSLWTRHFVQAVVVAQKFDPPTKAELLRLCGPCLPQSGSLLHPYGGALELSAWCAGWNGSSQRAHAFVRPLSSQRRSVNYIRFGRIISNCLVAHGICGTMMINMTWGPSLSAMVPTTSAATHPARRVVQSWHRAPWKQHAISRLHRQRSHSVCKSKEQKVLIDPLGLLRRRVAQVQHRDPWFCCESTHCRERWLCWCEQRPRLQDVGPFGDVSLDIKQWMHYAAALSNLRLHVHLGLQRIP